MNRTVTIIVILAIVLAGGFLFLRGNGQTPEISTPQPQIEEPVATTVTESEEREVLVQDENSFIVESGNFFFEPNLITADSGEITITISRNAGFHTFVIDELGVKEQLSDGTTFSFTAEPGTYEFYCDVPGHRERGMFGTLEVK